MIRIFKLVVLLVISQVAFGQAPSNYTNINGRYRWIAGMFDSTFHIPKGSTPSLRTGGSTNSGGLFYNTSDSSVYTYTGTQWIKLRGSINPSDTTNKYVTQVYKKNASDSVFYVKGGNHLFAFIDSVGSPGGGGGGKVYYFNGGVSMGTFGGFAMYELGDTANTGAAANFTRSTTGNIANFITDPNKPGLLQIPAGVWSVDAWLSETGGGANHAEIWVEVEKWDGSTITTIATSPIEQITEGATPNLYSWSVSIPTTSLTVTDRIIIQFYISNTNGKTVTLYTQNGYVGEVHTTFTTGIGAINGLTTPAQYLVTGTSGTDFNINSATATHTFNLPTASATNRGALSTTDWTTFNSKIGPSDTASMLANYITGPQNQSGYMARFNGGGTIDTSRIFQNNGLIGINTTGPSYSLDVLGTGRVTSNTYLATSSGVVGIGTASADSLLTVQTGAWIKRGLRLSGLPTGTGTKSLRVDANGTVSLADTLANGISGTGTTNYIPKFTSSSAIGNSAIYDNGGNIGVGLTDAQSPLEVQSNSGGTAIRIRGRAAANSGTLRFFTNDGVTQQAKFEASDNAIEIGGLTNVPLLFYTNNSERMRLDASGRVSIGGTTVTDGHLLNIQGSSAANNIGIILNKTNATAQIWGITNVGALTFYDYTNSAERMRLDASGNLGLGVSPSAWSLYKAIQVQGASIANFDISDNSIVGSNVFYGGSPTDFRYISTGTSTMYRLNGGAHYWYTAPSGTAGNAISFTQAMTLDASGRLGIGVTSLNNNLEVYQTGTAGNNYVEGTVKVGGSTSSLGAALSYAALGSGYVNISNLNNGGGANSRINFGFGAVTSGSPANTIMTINQSGNVGIGTTSPNNLLTLYNASSAIYSQWVQSGTGTGSADGLRIGLDASSNGIIDLNEGTALITSVNGSERMRITSGGELLINTTSDAGDYKLQVSGNSYLNGFLDVLNSRANEAAAEIKNTNTTNGYGLLVRGGVSGVSYGLKVVNAANSIDLFRVEGDGSIKTAAPSGGTAKPWKLGEAGVSVGGANTTAVKVEIDGVVYYLLTAYLPEPAPESAPKPKPEG